MPDIYVNKGIPNSQYTNKIDVKKRNPHASNETLMRNVHKWIKNNKITDFITRLGCTASLDASENGLGIKVL